MLNAETIYDAIKANDHNYREFGIRTCADDCEIGEELEPSYNWDWEKDEDEWEKLDGTCATGFAYLSMDESDKEADLATIQDAISTNEKYTHLGKHTYLIATKYGSSYGDDDGEVILQYAEVVAILR